MPYTQGGASPAIAFGEAALHGSLWVSTRLPSAAVTDEQHELDQFAQSGAIAAKGFTRPARHCCGTVPPPPSSALLSSASTLLRVWPIHLAS